MSCGLCLGRVRQRAEIPKISWEVPRGGGGDESSAARARESCQSATPPGARGKVCLRHKRKYLYRSFQRIASLLRTGSVFFKAKVRVTRTCLQCRIIANHCRMRTSTPKTLSFSAPAARPTDPVPAPPGLLNRSRSCSFHVCFVALRLC